MITLHTLASGSSGNAALISWEGGRVLADAGISCKRIRDRLRALDVQPEDLSGILITHTHGDHVSGLRQLLKWTSCPVWATARTGQELTAQTAGLESRLREAPLCRAVDGGGFKLTAAPTSHDAPGSCGYRLDFPEGSVGLLTDTGVVTPEAEDILSGVALVMLEANHDVEMLREGPYSYPLKRRVLGPEGHLSNEAAGAFAVTLAKAGASSIVLAHLSAQNNAPALAWKAVRDALAEAGLEPRLSVAEPDKVCGPFAVQALVRG